MSPALNIMNIFNYLKIVLDIYKPISSINHHPNCNKTDSLEYP